MFTCVLVATGQEMYCCLLLKLVRENMISGVFLSPEQRRENGKGIGKNGREIGKGIGKMYLV